LVDLGSLELCGPNLVQFFVGPSLNDDIFLEAIGLQHCLPVRDYEVVCRLGTKVGVFSVMCRKMYFQLKKKLSFVCSLSLLDAGTNLEHLIFVRCWY
jgi:hypothetical protein